MHSLIAGIANSFTDNLIAEQRYRMILDGLQVTLLITFCAAVLGTLLGGVVCWARMSRKPWLRQTVKIYIDLMRGTPVLVLLMLMYYVFMAPLGANGTLGGYAYGPNRKKQLLELEKLRRPSVRA